VHAFAQSPSALVVSSWAVLGLHLHVCFAAQHLKANTTSNRCQPGVELLFNNLVLLTACFVIFGDALSLLSICGGNK